MAGEQRPLFGSARDEMTQSGGAGLAAARAPAAAGGSKRYMLRANVGSAEEQFIGAIELSSGRPIERPTGEFLIRSLK